MSATLAILLKQDPKAELAVSCINKVYDGEYERHMFKGHYGGRFLVADLAGMYGAEATVEQIRLKFRCSVWAIISIANAVRAG